MTIEALRLHLEAEEAIRLERLEAGLAKAVKSIAGKDGKLSECVRSKNGAVVSIAASFANAGNGGFDISPYIPRNKHSNDASSVYA